MSWMLLPFSMASLRRIKKSLLPWLPSLFFHWIVMRLQMRIDNRSHSCHRSHHISTCPPASVHSRMLGHHPQPRSLGVPLLCLQQPQRPKMRARNRHYHELLRHPCENTRLGQRAAVAVPLHRQHIVRHLRLQESHRQCGHTKKRRSGNASLHRCGPASIEGFFLL